MNCCCFPNVSTYSINRTPSVSLDLHFEEFFHIFYHYCKYILQTEESLDCGRAPAELNPERLDNAQKKLNAMYFELWEIVKRKGAHNQFPSEPYQLTAPSDLWKRYLERFREKQFESAAEKYRERADYLLKNAYRLSPKDERIERLRLTLIWSQLKNETKKYPKLTQNLPQKYNDKNYAKLCQQEEMQFSSWGFLQT